MYYTIAYINFIFVLKSYLVMVSIPFFFEVLQMGEMEKHSHNVIWNIIGYT